MIKLPQMSHRFRITIQDYNVSQYISKCEFDYINRQIQLIVKQPADDADLIHLAIFHLGNRKVDITYNQLDGSGQVLTSNLFSCSTIIKHQFTLDYASEEPAVHIITFEFNNMATISKVNN